MRGRQRTFRDHLLQHAVGAGRGAGADRVCLHRRQFGGYLRLVVLRLRDQRIRRQRAGLVGVQRRRGRNRIRGLWASDLLGCERYDCALHQRLELYPRGSVEQQQAEHHGSEQRLHRAVGGQRNLRHRRRYQHLYGASELADRLRHLGFERSAGSERGSRHRARFADLRPAPPGAGRGEHLRQQP
jgi:hypothetical protein